MDKCSIWEVWIDDVEGELAMVKSPGAARQVLVVEYVDLQHAQAENESLRREVEVLEDCRACLEHALAMGHLTPEGSTEGWAKRVLSAADELKKEREDG